MDVGNDEITAGRQTEADPDFTQRRDLEEFSHQRVNDVVHEWNEEEDEDRICRLHLLGQELKPEETQIHFLALERPGTAAALIPERPEDRDKDVNDRQPAQSAEAFLAKELLDETNPRRRDVDEFLATGPEENRRDHHRHAGQTKRVTRAPIR